MWKRLRPSEQIVDMKPLWAENVAAQNFVIRSLVGSGPPIKRVSVRQTLWCARNYLP